VVLVLEKMVDFVSRALGMHQVNSASNSRNWNEIKILSPVTKGRSIRQMRIRPFQEKVI
jgi:hypothetical protein